MEREGNDAEGDVGGGDALGAHSFKSGIVEG